MKRFLVCLTVFSALILAGCGDGRTSGATAPSVGEIRCKSLPQSVGNTTINNVNVDCGDDVAIVPPVVVDGAVAE